MTSQKVDAGLAIIADLLDVGIQLEAAAQDLYGGFAEMFSRCPEVAGFWCLLASDEAIHRGRLVQVRASTAAGKLSQPADTRILRESRRLLAVTVEERLREVHDLDDAYEMANDLESSETNTIFRFFVTEFSRDARVVAALMHDLDVHVERLITQFPAQYRTRTSRMAVKANHVCLHAT